MEKWALHFLILLFFMRLSGNTQAWENYQTGARSAALGNASAALKCEEALFHNQAGIVSANNFSIVFSCQTRFLLKELALFSTGLILPTSLGTFAGSITRFGTGVCHQDLLGLTFARNLGHHFSASLTFDSLSEKYPENSHPFRAMTFEAGILFSVNDKWTAALHIFNPPAVNIRGPAGKSPVPVKVRTGIKWNISTYLTTFHELDIATNRSPSLHTGLEFTPFPDISFRAGISGDPPEFCVGAGFCKGWMEFDLAFEFHNSLGLTPVAGIRIRP